MLLWLPLAATNLIDTGFETSDGWTTKSSGNWNQTAEDGTWYGNSMYVNTTDTHGGDNKAGMNSADDWLKSPQVNNPGVLTYWYRTSTVQSTVTWTAAVEYSTDGNTWTQAGDSVDNMVGTAYTQATVTLNLTGSYYLRWHLLTRTGSSMYFDDIVLTAYGDPQSLQVDFSATPVSGYAPLSTTFTSVVSGGTTPYTYAWTFGDGGTSTLANPQHSYTSTGTYTVNLLVNDTASHSQTVQKSAYITVSTSGGQTGYYASVSGLSGTALYNGLHTLISTNTNTDYDDSKLQMFGYLDNTNNTVRCVYTGQDYTVTHGTMANQNILNCEHTYAQSWFGYTSVPKADLHHLFPVTMTVNSSRGNLPFGVVTGTATTYASANGYVSKRGNDSNGHTVFEPADQHKGDLARAILYFAVRYNMGLSYDNVDMESTLLAWSAADPVSQKEVDRNEGIYAYQGNRNPFIDHPEYVNMIWGGASTNTTVYFTSGSTLVNENAGTITVSVSIANPSTTAATSVTVSLVNGSSTDLVGYAPVTVVFPAGSTTSRSINLQINDDNLVEGRETLVLGLSAVSGGNAASIASPFDFNLTIDDNDIPTPVLHAATSITQTGFTAAWSPLSGITGFEFDLATDSAFTSYVNGYQSLAVSDTLINITGLAAGTTYYFRVRSLVNESYGSNSTTGTVTTTVAASSGLLMISEYIEGSSNNKAIELYNPSLGTIDLSQYSLKKQVNGAGNFGSELVLSGTLASASTYVIVYSSASTTLRAYANLTTSSGSLSFNGNDAVALYHQGEMIDMVGVQDQTTNWGADVTLVRKSSVTGPSLPFSMNQWDSYTQDTFAYLGSHTINTASPLSVYFSAAVTSGEAPFSVSFAPSISGGNPPYTLLWNYGDGSAADSSRVHTYINVGIYGVTLSVTDASNTNAQIAKASFITVTAPVTPASPAALYIVVSNNNVQLSWPVVDNATGYSVYRSLNPDSSDWGTPIAHTISPSYVDVNVSAASSYFYRVTATR